VSTQEPGSSTAPGLTALPRVEDLPTTSGGGYDADKVRDAFDAFRRHSAQLQAQLRVLQAAGRTSAHVEPTGHSVRMDALHLIRAAAEFADTLERDAQNAASAQLGRTEEEVSARQHALQDREAEIERYRQESERQRAEILNASKAEARELLANAHRDASQELREAEARGSRLLEQSRHQATELTNSARAEVEQTLEWARAQAGAILQRAQQGAEQLLRAAGLGEPALGEVADAILAAARESTGTPRPPHGPAVVPPVSEPEAEADEAPIGGPPPVEEAHEAAETEEPEERQPPAADAPPAPPVSAPPLTSPPPPPVSPLVPPPVASQDEPADEDEGEPGERA
jgi:F0F1-type ATP synthase membrane subunit b/b'